MSESLPPTDPSTPHAGPPASGLNFVQQRVEADRAAGRWGGQVVTRFPPEPNGYLHIGHAKSICLNFGLAEQYGGRCHLRFDDTNPAKEEQEYIESIQEDVRWLGFDWGDHLYHASDYFERLYEYAEMLIHKGLAYVDDQTQEEIRTTRGSLTEPGTPSPYRDRSVDENLDLFRRMRAGEFPDGSKVLRAKIDMASPNMLMRDPLLYRIRHAHHVRTGDAWCIYPLYDFTHCISDAIEGITHSICTLEFENNRELYDWVLAQGDWEEPPNQIEFAHLNLAYTMMSKRNLLKLVQEGVVTGWDDPRMPTISGLRRRGVRPEAIRQFADMIGVAKANSLVDLDKLEFCVRDDLNHEAPRVMAVLRPLKVTVTNWPQGKVEELDASYWPHDVPREGSRKVPFSGELYIERADFAEDPPKGFRRLAPGREVRLRYGYFIRCDEVVHDEAGEVIELRCTYDPATRGGHAPTDARGLKRKVQGTIHWVSATQSVPCEVRLYDRLFAAERPGADGRDFHEDLNPHALEVIERAFVEPSLAGAGPMTRVQFERHGYFVTDAKDSRPDALVFNRVVSLKDTWAKRRKPAATPHRPDAAAAKAPKSKAPHEARQRPERRSRTEAREQLRAEDPALAARFDRYAETLGLPTADAEILAHEPALAALFEEALAAYDAPPSVAKWTLNEVRPRLSGDAPAALRFGGGQVGELARLVDEGRVTATAAKRVFEIVAETGDAPAEVIQREGLEAVDDAAALAALVDEALTALPDEAARLRGGEKKLTGLFIGRIMRATGGSADAKLVRKLLMERVSA